MDILYIVGEGVSQCNNNELKYSLRSIEKFGGESVGRVFVAGYCPKWLSNKVIKVPFKQPYDIKNHKDDDQLYYLSLKHANMIATVLYVVDNTDIEDEFLVSMDDHIYIRNVDFNNYPYYVKKFRNDNLLPKLGTTKSPYKTFLSHTREYCEREGLTSYYFCPHRNMHISRYVINQCRDFIEADIKNPIPCETLAYIINWKYCKVGGFEPTPVTDMKLFEGREWWKANPDITEVISTSDFNEGSGLDTLLSWGFPKKSKYEK